MHSQTTGAWRLWITRSRNSPRELEEKIEICFKDTGASCGSQTGVRSGQGEHWKTALGSVAVCSLPRACPLPSAGPLLRFFDPQAHISQVENEAHSRRAKPRQRPRGLYWRWKLVENPDCVQGLPSRPQRRIDTNFTLRSLLETLIHKDNHCQPPFIYCKSQVPK